MNAPTKAPRMCSVCRGPMPTGARRDAKACGQVCRQRAHRQRHARPRPLTKHDTRAMVDALAAALDVIGRLVDGEGVGDDELEAAHELVVEAPLESQGRPARSCAHSVAGRKNGAPRWRVIPWRMGKSTPFGELLAGLVTHLERAQALAAELAAVEVMQPLPERGKDDTDLAARRVVCPACKARAGNPCSWAQSHASPSYVAHASRRALVKA